MYQEFVLKRFINILEQHDRASPIEPREFDLNGSALPICLTSGLPGGEEARFYPAPHAGRAGRGHHHLRRAAVGAQLCGHPPQQQQGRTPLPQPEALHGHTQSPGGRGVVAHLPGRGPDGGVSHCEGELKGGFREPGALLKGLLTFCPFHSDLFIILAGCRDGSTSGIGQPLVCQWNSCPEGLRG